MADDDRSDWVWLAYPGGGPAAQFPPAAAPLWRAKGWVDSDPPPEPNPLKDPEPGTVDEPEPAIDTSAIGDPPASEQPPPGTSDFATRPDAGDGDTDEPEE